MKTLFQGGTLALPSGPAKLNMLVEGEKIVAIGENLPADGVAVVDATGCIVLPGAVDTHTHFDLPVSGTVTADDFESGTAAAILGGTTTILDFATQDKGDTLRHAYDVWRGRMDGKASCDVGFHMAVVDWNEATAREIGEMGGLGITSYKLYLAYPALMVEDDAIYAALKRIREVEGIAGFHCENGRLVVTLTEELRRQGRLDPTAHPRSRPPEVEAEAIARLLRIAQLADAPVNVVHLSSRLGLEAILNTRAPRQVVHVETCPQYLLLDDSLYAREDGAKFVCSPPLRTPEDSKALWGALADGIIQTVGTDHCSFNYGTQKIVGKDDFSKIPNGMPGVEDRLSLMMTEGVDKGRLSLTRLTEVLCENPARLFGLYPRKGVLAVGSDADIVLWDPSKPRVLSAAHHAQRVDYTPFEGWTVSGSVRAVWLRGRSVVENATLTLSKTGQFLSRTTPNLNCY